MNFILNWIDDRTGYRKLLHEALYENIPGGASFRYAAGSMLVFAFVTQVITGIFLWMFYSAGSQNAWESVYWIQNEIQGGWLLRGVHHFMSQAMVILLAVHMLQVVIDGAYLKPREMNYWFGLVLMLITLALSLTGYLLPWDQKGFWATKVATNLMALAPGGEYIQKLVVGGSDYGHYTLTRFFALHAGLLPGLLIFFVVLHIAMFRKHGITAHSSPKRRDEYFWPKQVFFDAFACFVLLFIVLMCCVNWNPLQLMSNSVDTGALGAELSAPADPVEEYSAARPEWYFMFLFQLLKKFKNEFIGAIVVPSVVMLFLFLLPFFGRVKMGHIINVVVVLILIVGAGYLTVEGLYQDHYAGMFKAEPGQFENDPNALEFYKDSANYIEAVERGEIEYERVKELVKFHGIPREGAVTLQRNDPETMGPRIFKRNCASCHSYLDEDGKGIVASESSAPNLYGFATENWFRRILDPKQIAGHEMFGNTKHKSGGMVDYVTNTLPTILADDAKRAQFDLVIAALESEANLKRNPFALPKKISDADLELGRKAIVEVYACTDCHTFRDTEGGDAPNLTGYGSHDWLVGFISDPSHTRFYGENNDRMPSFAKDPEKPEENLLSAHELNMLAAWLRGDARHLGTEPSK